MNVVGFINDTVEMKVNLQSGIRLAMKVNLDELMPVEMRNGMGGEESDREQSNA